MELRTSAFKIDGLHLAGTLTSQVPAQLLLESKANGISLVEMVKNGHLSPVEVAGALALLGLSVNDQQGPPLQRNQPLLPQWHDWLVVKAWRPLFPDAPETALLNLAAGLYQIFDFWDESHSAAQRADDLGEHRLSAHWHAICHRREPDPFNSNYWWNRVGKNPVAGLLTSWVENSLNMVDESTGHLARTLIETGVYSDRAMVSANGSVCNGSNEEKFLRILQKYEFVFVFDVTLHYLH